MKVGLYFKVFLFIVFIFFSCSKDEPVEPEIVEEPPHSIEVIVIHNPNRENMLLGNARVFLYNHRDKFDFTGHSYIGDGIYQKDKSFIKPDKVLFTDSYGKVIIIPEDKNMQLCAFIENRILDRLGYLYWYDCSKEKKVTLYFN